MGIGRGRLKNARTTTEGARGRRQGDDSDRAAGEGEGGHDFDYQEHLVVIVRLHWLRCLGDGSEAGHVGQRSCAGGGQRRGRGGRRGAGRPGAAGGVPRACL